MVLYAMERLWRVKRSQRTIYLKTIKWIPPVLELNFCPKYKEDLDFVEGQYLYLNCPFLSVNEVGVQPLFSRAQHLLPSFPLLPPPSLPPSLPLLLVPLTLVPLQPHGFRV